MIATTIEQSKRLLELGLDPNTADMYYTGHRSIYNPKEIEYTQVPRVRTKFVSFDRLEVFFPAWSLSALLEVMPKPDLYRDVADCWVCATFFKEGSVRGFGKTAIEAACDTITKMFKNGLLQ